MYSAYTVVYMQHACVALTKGRNDGREEEVDDAALAKVVLAPDFPTEACIIGRSGARKPYTTARHRSASR